MDLHKKWIGNGSIADVVVVWARDTSDATVKRFLIEKGTPGYAFEGTETIQSLIVGRDITGIGALS